VAKTSSSSVVPAAARTRLHGLFREVEKEFEALYLENARLRERVQRLEKGEVGVDEKEKVLEKDEPDAFEAMLR